MPSSEFVELVQRNAEFLAVRRTGSGDGICGLYNGVTGEYLCGIGGGILPEYTFYRQQHPQCVRGWRNILYDLVHKRYVRATKGVRRVLGDEQVNRATDCGYSLHPFHPGDDSRRYDHESRKMAGGIG